MAVSSHCAENLKLSGNPRARPKGEERKEQRRGSHGTDKDGSRAVEGLAGGEGGIVG